MVVNDYSNVIYDYNIIYIYNNAIYLIITFTGGTRERKQRTLQIKLEQIFPFHIINVKETKFKKKDVYVLILFYKIYCC